MINHKNILPKKIFCKTGPKDVLLIEKIKSQIAARVGSDSGLFFVPEILISDNKDNLAFSYVSDLKTLSSILDNSPDLLPPIIKKLGHALAIIHNQLILPNLIKKNLPHEWLSVSKNVYLHGDLTIQNVGFVQSQNQLVIVDWSMTSLFDYKMNFGSRYFDIIWFIGSLFLNSPTKITYSKLENLANIFVNSYKKCIGGYINFNTNILAQAEILNKKRFKSRIKNRNWFKKIPFFIRMLIRHRRLMKYLNSYR